LLHTDDNYVFGSIVEKTNVVEKTNTAEEINTAVKTKYDVYEENSVLRAKKRQRATFKFKVKLVLFIVAAFGACWLLMYRYALITELTYKINTANKQYNNILSENVKLKVEIERQIDLQKIRELAETKLGMHKPDKYETVYIKVPKNDYTQVSDAYKKQAANQNTISVVKDIVGKIIRYLE